MPIRAAQCKVQYIEMPPAGEALDDDYVINLLKKDAESNQKRYLSNGLGSLLSKQPKGNAPKPNTRFLKNIIRETDNHNAALKAKEEGESRARLQDPRGAKRRRDGDRDEGSSKRKRGEEKQSRWANAFGGLGRGAQKREARTSDLQKHGKESKSRSDVRCNRNGTEDDGSQRRERRERRSSISRPRSRSPGHRKEHRRRSSARSRSPVRRNGHYDRAEQHDGSDSDPLGDVVGPIPPPKSLPRGRGALKSSDMDSRFDPTYDPKSDVNLDPEEDRDDWDMALEALRDRAKWKSQGADRLRAAGFTDEDVSKWEKGGEKDIDDVRWRKKGEGREWDRGKVVGDDGQTDVKADWARMKST